ncbi:site-specific DNA-methyltransferase [Bradyrhizobium brasilense]|uniref:DNA-methyltransferase n=1 Tax=Bradyrhizobium brasilense TaxID=1419277 RepID=UPI0024B18EA8|nr:site-specific DNA-methyltransferase [Bradyrhizobium australafricanum]WFU32390.1 site-specific DNA-methyltransferase [Bradyrhizobium australafricanum]
MPSSSVDLVCTDPPYGDDAAYGRSQRTIIGNEHPLLGLIAIADCYRLLRRNRCCFVFLDAKHLAFVDTFVRRYTDYTIREYLVWDKCHIGMGRGFRKRHEMILALEKGSPTYNSDALPNVLASKRVSTNEHPHKKPIDLIKALISHVTLPGHVVLDPFVGSGTTALAAKELGRRYIAIERDAEHFRTAQTRIGQACQS